MRVAHQKRRYNANQNAGDHMAAQQQPFDDVIRRVQGEYIEMPGLRLTTAQAQRLWGLDRSACDTLLGALVDAKFLFRTETARSCGPTRPRRAFDNLTCPACW